MTVKPVDSQASRAKAATASLPDIRQSNGRRLVVLVVDPDPEFRRQVQQEVGALGHFATVFTNCTDAWAAMQDMQFDVLIIDLDTPAITATELARRASQLPSLPAMIATSHNITDRNRIGMDLCRRSGFQSVVSKNASRLMVKRALGKALGQVENEHPPSLTLVSGVEHNA